MAIKLLNWQSLKTRVTLFTLVIFMISIWTVALYASSILRQDMQKLLGNQQFSTVTTLASEANQVLTNSLSDLASNAQLIGPGMMADEAGLADFFSQRPVLFNQFGGGIVTLNIEGTVLFEYPGTERIGTNYRDVDSVAGALAHGRTTVGSPTIDAKLQIPILSMTTPIRDSDGTVVGALAGIINLNAPSVLDQIIEKYNGKTGYFLLVDPKNWLIVTSTGKRRIMELLPPQGKNALFDRFVQSYDGWGVGVDTTGTEILVSSKRVDLTDWYLMSALPTDEAFEPIVSLQQRMLLAATLLTLLSGVLTWWMLWHELSPMLRAVKTLASLSEDTDQPPQSLPVARDNEIGELITAFNRLLETLSQRESALKKAFVFQQTLMDAVPSPIFYKDANCVYLGSNKAYEQLSHLPREQLIGKTVYDTSPPDLAALYAGHDRELIENQGVQTYETSVVAADGTTRDVIYNKATYTDLDGKVAGLIGVVLDITERKKSETELHHHVERLTELNSKLEAAQNQLLQSEKMASVGQLAAGVAHEINNPIGFINSNLGSLKGQVKDLLNVIDAYTKAEPLIAGHAELFAQITEAKAQADLEFLQEDIVNLIDESLDGVHRVKKIVDNLKDFSRVDTAEWQFANLEDGLDSTLNIVWNEIKYKAEVEKRYAGLPTIECIASQLNQVFMNLMINAAHAIDDRGTITLRTGFDDKEVWVEVEDTGHGISPEHLNKIFEPFFTTKPVGKGTGLGLSLAYGIVKRHQGRLEARSELRKGSVFRLTLPRTPRSATPPAAEA